MEEISNAINILYTTTDDNQRNMANDYIIQFQRKPEAWTIAVELAKNENPYANFMGAQILLTKIQLDFKQLPKESWDDLRSKLFELIKNPNCTRQAKSSLCLAISTLAMEMTTWRPILPYILQNFQQTQGYMDLLEILQYLPDCAGKNKSYIQVDSKLFDDFTFALVEMSSDVFNVLAQMLQQIQDTILQIHVVQCFKSWIMFGEISSEQIEKHQLLRLILSLQHHPDLLLEILDLLIEISCYYTNINEDILLLQLIYPYIISLDPIFTQEITNDDTDILKNYVNLFCEFGETFLPVIREQKSPELISLMTLLSKCLTIGDYDLTLQARYFWYNLCEDISKSKDDVIAFVNYYNAPLLSVFDICIMRFNLPMSFDTSPQSLKKLYLNFRNDLRDVFMALCSILPLDHLLRRFEDLYRTALSKYTTDFDYIPIECMLYSITAIRPLLRPDVYPLIVECLKTCVQIRQPDQLLQQVFNFIGYYAYVFSKTNELDLLTYINFVREGVRHQSCSNNASMAMKDLCRHNVKTIISNQTMFSSIIELRELLYILKSRNQREIIEAMCEFTEHFKMSETTHLLHLILDPFINDIKTIIDGNLVSNSETEVRLMEDIMIIYRVIEGSIFLELAEGQEHPVIGIAQPLLHYLPRILQSFPQSEPISDKVCCFYRTVLRKASVHLLPILPDLMTLFLDQYLSSYHCGYLYATSIIGEVFLGIESQVSSIYHLFNVMVERTIIRLSTLDQCRESPDLLCDFLRLITKFFRVNPLLFWQSTSTKIIIDYSLSLMFLDDPNISRGVYFFFESIIDCPTLQISQKLDRVEDVVIDFMNTYGDRFIQSLSIALQGRLPIGLLTDDGGSLSTVIYAIKQCEYIKENILLQFIGYIQNDFLSSIDRDHFYDKLVESGSIPKCCKVIGQYANTILTNMKRVHSIGVNP